MFNSWIDKKGPHIKLSQYFPKPFRSSGGNIKVKVDLSNYATKTDLKNVIHVDTWGFVLKTNIASVKPEVDELDIDKLAPVPQGRQTWGARGAMSLRPPPFFAK